MIIWGELMEMAQLETFTCLVQQGNFSRAAKELGVSQPTVTIRMKALEDELGMPLIIRAGHKVELTPTGQIFYEYIERSLRVLNDGIDSLTVSHGPLTQRIAVAGTSNLCTYFLPPILGKFYRLNRDWEFSLTIGHSWEVVEMILDEVCHIGFINGYCKHPDIITIPLFKDPFYLVAYPEHPLANRETLTLYDLTEETIFTYKLESNMSYMIKNLFRDIKLKTDMHMELNDSYTMKQMVMEGNGIGFMPWSAAEPEVMASRLIVLPLELPIPLMREVNLITNKRHFEQEQVNKFLFYIDEILLDFKKGLFSSLTKVNPQSKNSSITHSYLY